MIFYGNYLEYLSPNRLNGLINNKRRFFCCCCGCSWVHGRSLTHSTIVANVNKIKHFPQIACLLEGIRNRRHFLEKLEQRLCSVDSYSRFNCIQCCCGRLIDCRSVNMVLTISFFIVICNRTMPITQFGNR